MLAEAADELVGFAVVGADRDTDAARPPSCTRSTSAAAWWGTGLGQRSGTPSAPRQACSLWVLEDNAPRPRLLRPQRLRRRRRSRALRRRSTPGRSGWSDHEPRHDPLRPVRPDLRRHLGRGARAPARQDWYVETNWGWAVLRYAEVSALLRDRRFRQGNARWPAQNGIHSGLFSDWWQETLLSLEGDDHSRIRRLLMPAFRNKTIAAMRPRFQALANELIDGFADRGPVRVHQRVRRAVRRPHHLRAARPARGPLAPGRAVGRRPRARRSRSTSATRCRGSRRRSTGLYDYVDEVVADRRAHPRDDLVTTLRAGHRRRRPAQRRTSSAVALVFLAFAGMETTRNQLGLALQTLLAAPRPVAAARRAARPRRATPSRR